MLLIFAIASTVSRSGVLGLVVGLAVFIPFLPTTPRIWALIASPVALAGLFLGVPGLISTLTETVTSSSTDPSISTRTNNYPRVEAMVAERPFLGAGPGNYPADTAIHILDNEYLNAAVTLGLVGLFAVAIYLVVPGVFQHTGRAVVPRPAIEVLAGAVGAGGIVAGICSLTFDSLSFPVFALTYPVLVGLGGAVWMMAKAEKQDEWSRRRRCKPDSGKLKVFKRQTTRRTAVDPLAVLKTLWQHRIVSIPILLLTLAAAIYVFQFAPRSYETSSTYAMINPDIPTQQDC